MTKNEKATLARGKVSRTFKFANATVTAYDATTKDIQRTVDNYIVASEQQAIADIKRHLKESGINVLEVEINSYTDRFVAMDTKTFIELAEINHEI